MVGYENKYQTTKLLKNKITVRLVNNKSIKRHGKKRKKVFKSLKTVEVHSRWVQEIPESQQVLEDPELPGLLRLLEVLVVLWRLCSLDLL